MGKISVETDKIFKIALPGYDVETATPEQCAVHSGFDYPKIEEHLEGYEEITMSNSIPTGTSVLKTITHNYGYKPNVLIYVYIIDPVPSLYNTTFTMLPYLFSDPLVMWYDYEVTNTEVKIEFIRSGSGELTPGDDSPAGKKIGFKWKVMVND